MATQPPDGSTDSAHDQLAEMKREMRRMEEEIRRLASASAFENILINGFTTLSEQLQPLAELAPPKRTQMEKVDRDKLTQVRAELARQNWSGSTDLKPKPRPPGTDTRQEAY